MKPILKRGDSILSTALSFFLLLMTFLISIRLLFYCAEEEKMAAMADLIGEHVAITGCTDIADFEKNFGDNFSNLYRVSFEKSDYIPGTDKIQLGHPIVLRIEKDYSVFPFLLKNQTLSAETIVLSRHYWRYFE